MHPYVDNTLPERRLIAAAASGRADDVRKLLDAGADVSFRGVFGETALHWAAAHGDASLVVAILDAGASATATTHTGEIPASVAAAYGHPALQQLLQHQHVEESSAPLATIAERVQLRRRTNEPSGRS